MNKYIITISRQFGANGSAIAKKISEMFNIEFFDKEKLIQAFESSGISRDAVERADEKPASSFLYSLAMSSYSGGLSPLGINDVMISDKMFIVQSNEIKKAANEGSCIFIGRCADDILATYESLNKNSLTRIFIHAPIEERIKNIMMFYNLNESTAKTLIKKTDKKRSSYYNFYTNKEWGSSKNYDITIDSYSLGIEKSAKLLMEYAILKGQSNK